MLDTHSDPVSRAGSSDGVIDGGGSKKVGYIGIGEEDVGSGSYKAMAKEMAAALAELTASGMNGLVLDIRGNDGGEDGQAPAILESLEEAPPIRECLSSCFVHAVSKR